MSEGETGHRFGVGRLRCRGGSALMNCVRERAPGRGGMVGIVICLTLFLLIVVVMSMRFSGTNEKWDNWYSPGETRLGCHSSLFCSGVTLENPSLTSSASVYLLRNEPQLTARYNFTITKTIVLFSGYYQYWNFYLYPGSNYTFSSCLTSGTVSYYLIKGTADFRNWHTGVGYWFDFASYSNVCGGSNKTLTQSFTAEDEYYFVLYNPYAKDAKIQVTLTFERTEYVAQTQDVVRSCVAAPSSQCSIGIPYNSDYAVLVEAGPPEDGDWGEGVELDTACNPRVWVYVLIVLFPSLAVIALVSCIAVACCFIKRNSRYAPLPPATYNVVSMSTIEDSESANPPPYTPEETLPPSYKPNPPAYTP